MVQSRDMLHAVCRERIKPLLQMYTPFSTSHIKIKSIVDLIYRLNIPQDALFWRLHFQFLLGKDSTLFYMGKDPRATAHPLGNHSLTYCRSMKVQPSYLHQSGRGRGELWTPPHTHTSHTFEIMCTLLL